MEILNSRLQKLKSKKGFTLIELLAVIAIIAVLVLIAAPSFLGSKEKATLAAVKADIKTAELAIGRHLLEHETLAKHEVNGKEVGFDKYTPESGKDYYSNKGKLDTPVGGDLYDISKIIDSKVLDKGDLVASDNGKVYFVTDEGKLKTPGKGNSSTGGTGGSGTGEGTGGSGTGEGTGGSGTGEGTGGSGNDGTGGEKEPEVKPVSNSENDFDWVNHPNGYTFENQTDKGYWKYIGDPEEVVIPEKIKGVTLTNYYSMFKGTSVTKVTSTNKKVTDMNYMFYESKAASIDLRNLDTSSVTDMRDMFRYSKATSLDLSNFDTSSVNTMQSMFQSSHAKSLDLSNFDTSSVTDMNNMFQSSLAKTLTLSSFDTSNVRNMNNMFYASSAEILDLSSFDTSVAFKRENMFQGANATIGYAKTYKDLQKFTSNAEYTKLPSWLKFTVKQK